MNAPYSQDNINGIVACGSLTTAGNAITVCPSAVGIKLAGLASTAITRTSAGLYVITLPAGSLVSFADGEINCWLVGVAALDFTWHVVSWTAAGVITIQWNVAAVATDAGDWCFTIKRAA